MNLTISWRKYIFAAICLIFSACDLINPEEDIPAYISITNFSFQADTLTQGSSSQKITDAWIYIDDVLIGTFELPVKAPVLYSGDHQVKIFAGIKANGIAASRVSYPFYAEHVQNIKLTPKETVTITPLFKYITYAKFLWLENFEKDTFSLKKSDGSDTTLFITNENVFEGHGAGKFVLDDTHPEFAYLSKQNYTLSVAGAKTYLELNYKSSGQFQVGVNSHYDTYSQPRTALTVNPSLDDNGNPVWNKIYVDLTNSIALDATSNNFSVFIAAIKETGAATQVTYLDNIKLISQ